MYKITISSPVGILRIVSDGRSVTELKTVPARDAEPDAECDVLLRAKHELARYFAGTLTTFSVPLSPEGSAFRRKVWRALMRIPYGQTVTYGEIARAIQKETASRAVGQACGMNPIWILIPCHRVVGANGLISGYAGGIETKRFLLSLEKRSAGIFRQ